MSQFGTLILVHVFSALLPPVDQEEKTYYHVLNLERNASEADIRKAYKKISLKLHPDKVAQRGGLDAEEAAKEYEKVQEAYSVLANKQKRETYDALRTPTRYRFYTQGALANPGALYENLTGASFIDKTKIVGFVTVLILLILLQPILICSKINQDLEKRGGLQDTSWFVVLIPYWIVGGVIIILTSLLVPFIPPRDRLSIALSALEQCFWYLAMIFLCLRWDGTWNNPYRQIFAPVYIAVLLRWTQSLVTLGIVRKDVQRMVTADYLEKEVLKGKSLEDLDEAELKELQQNYLVVTVPPEFVPYAEEGMELDEEKIEEQKVESSSEFEAATDLYNKTFGGLVCSLIFGTIFVILLTRKVDGNTDASWWIVFIPIFLERGGRWLLNLHRCMCGGVVGDEIIVHMSHETTEEEGTGKESKETAKKDQDEQVRLSPGKESIEENIDDTQSRDNGVSINKEDFKAEHNKPKEKDKDKSQTGASNHVDAAQSKEKTSADDTTAKETPEKAENIHIDEETFHAWQSAYEQAEENAMQEQAKASSECCNLTLQLILLCLIVAKVEKAYDSDDPSDSGFNMFWILAPFFIFFGIICCCCTLLIYGATPGNLADLPDTVDNEADNFDPENPPPIALEAPVVVPVPAATGETDLKPADEAGTCNDEETKPTDTENPDSEEGKEEKDENVEKVDSNMEELD